MKKSTKMTYYFHLILMLLILLQNFILIFLNKDDSSRSVYVFNMMQAFIFIILLFIGNKIIKKTSIEISNAVYIIVLLYFSAHFFLGEICGFYAKVKWWDSFLHTFSGVFLSFLSFTFINLINNTKNRGFKLNIAFSCIFAFTIAVTIGVLWEIIEYTSDNLFLTNMQRAYNSIVGGNSRGEPFVGQDALRDTMKDLILDSLGAFFSCILISTLCKKKKISIEDLNVIKVNKLEQTENPYLKQELILNENNIFNGKIEIQMKDINQTKVEIQAKED